MGTQSSSHAITPWARDRDTFLEFSSVLTGFNRLTLEGTGQVDVYAAQLLAVVGSETCSSFLNAARSALSHDDEQARDHAILVSVWASPVFGPLLTNLVTMWYVGEWLALPSDWYTIQNRTPNSSDTHVVVSAESYREGLVWRAAGAHPPGAKPTGFGGWGLKPVIRDEDIPGVTSKSRRSE